MRRYLVVVIMIVDDSAPMRSTIKDYLLRFQRDLDFCECEDGETAVAKYAFWKPDWVCMDIKMRGMDGIAATAAILRSYPSARIIMVSNFDDTELRTAAIEAGAIGYVPKDNLHLLKDHFVRTDP